MQQALHRERDTLDRERREAERDNGPDTVSPEDDWTFRLKPDQGFGVVIGDGLHGTAEVGIVHLLRRRLDAIKSYRGLQSSRQSEKIRAGDSRRRMDAIEGRPLRVDGESAVVDG